LNALPMSAVNQI